MSGVQAEAGEKDDLLTAACAIGGGLVWLN